MDGLTERQERTLCALLSELLDQHAAKILVAPLQAAPGFWFGGGNLVQDGDGVI